MNRVIHVIVTLAIALAAMLVIVAIVSDMDRNEMQDCHDLGLAYNTGPYGGCVVPPPNTIDLDLTPTEG